ncbi:ParB family chromosome partitioning protein [Microbacterium trichothecenolyticum]|uniref:ParB/RepB/Spo0J family partition protein n=1 Tax=Microbacterium trichothecenolyticum TaxID=69370 RepID=UPI002854DB8F|nr:ParB/RepB/Spo0J family partition protein [Microbacterium trichothecenolyticum]MDR7184596.1 ParB family chromosome partitioning protein [Microbacterium trichothecenolyticum]
MIIHNTGTLEHIAPTALTVETNVRTVAPLDEGFIASIRENGVLTPILAWRAQDGTLHVRAGQRRTLAAREAGIDTIPAYIVDAADDDTARRIVEQLIENDQREELTDADRIQAWRALELEGLSATAIAKRTGTKRDRIKIGLAVAASETATGLVAASGLTLDQAAILLEFDGDDETVAELTDVATTEPGYFPVAVERARQERAAREAKEKVEQEEAAKGHRILTERPGYSGAPYRVRMLRTAEGEPVEVEGILGKPSVAVYVATYYGGEARAEYFVDDPAAFGFTVQEDTYGGTSGAQSGPMTDEQKAERKELIANNKEWDAAETVRREWVAQFLARKTTPKNAQTVIADALTSAQWKIADGLTHGSSTAKAFLGIEDNHQGDDLSDYLTAHPNRATHVTLAMVLGGIEQNTNRQTWRSPSADTAWYLRTLQEWGYTLCPVEKIAAMLAVDE